MQGTDLVATMGGHRIALAPGEHHIGRGETCALRCDDLRVSRHHATLRCTDGGWVIEDAGSTGGTWRAAHRVTTLAVTVPVDLLLGDPTTGVVLHLEPAVPATPGDAAPSATAGPRPVAEAAGAGAVAATSAAATPTAPRPNLTGRFTGTYVSRERTAIGRALDNDIVVDDLLVSRYHAELRRTPDGRHEIVDLGSRNGTFVDGDPVTRRTLDDRARVGIGHSTFLFSAGTLEEYRDVGSVTFEAHGLTVLGSHGQPLIDDVGFHLGERSLCAVVGPSGSGKSTLLGALAGLRPATAGTVLYGGRDLYADYAELRNRIGYVPQEDILHRELAVRRALEYSGRLRFPTDVTGAERTARLNEVLVELGLDHRGDAPIHRLSGGERKRTSVALELLTKPSLLFLDEPASGLDPGLARVLMRLLRDLADSGRTIVVVTHELANLGLCDQVVVLAPGGVPAYVGEPQGAPGRFGRDDLTDVFGDLSTDPGRDWRDPTREPRADQPAAAPAATSSGRPVAPVTPAERPQLPPPLRQQGWWSQLRTLSARYLAVLVADRRNLALLLAQAPVLGVLMLAALPAGELGLPEAPEVRLVSTAGLVLFVVLLGATWMGANNAIREIARELPVLRRERAVGLSLSAYVTSKVVVLAGLTVLQGAVLVALATARQRGPTSAVVLGWPTGELMVVVALAGVASMTLALLVSALAGSPERATSVLPMLLILQLVLSAGVVLPEIAERPVLREMNTLSSAQWGVAAAASTADLNSLQLFDDRLRDLRTVDAADPVPAVEVLSGEAAPERRWAHTTRAWLTAVGALLALSLGAVLATVVVLRRFDPGR
jgi:ABC transport system ATP-binding/permease protein